MVKRLYVNNYRCLENFELNVGNMTSALIVGRNGSGKSTVREVLHVLQRIGRGVNRVGTLAALSDFSHGRIDVPMRIELEAEIKGKTFRYVLVLELPAGFREIRVSREELLVDGEPAYTREEANVRLAGDPRREDAGFRLDWHLIALPIIQDRSLQDPLSIFRTWLGQSLILSPVPPDIVGESGQGSLEPDLRLTNLAEWFRELTTQYPASYSDIEGYLKGMMPDLSVIRNKATGSESRQLLFEFIQGERTLTVPLDALSDGEKCFVAAALVVAANNAYGPLLCFWDEPDNHVGLSELNRLLLTLRKAFKRGSQFFATTHNPEAIRAFPREKAFVFLRASHLDPTRPRLASDLDLSGDLAGALLRGDLEA